jgi:hypothetical protein
MSILKKGVRFVSQDTGKPITREEIPFIVHSLAPAGLRGAAIVGICYLYQHGYSINKALEFLGEKPEEKQ